MFTPYDSAAKKSVEGSELFSAIVRHTKAEPTWKQVTRFLAKSTVGGILGAFLLTLACTAYTFRNENQVPRTAIILYVIVLAFVVANGAIAGFVVGTFALLLEALIEEKLSGLSLAIATTAIAVFMFFGLSAVANAPSWQNFEWSVIPGVIFGLPAGLLARSRFQPVLRLLLGVAAGPKRWVEPGNSPFSYSLSVVAGLVLRIASACGVAIALASLACSWHLLFVDQWLLSIFAVYYFGCTLIVTTWVRSVWVVGGAAIFLNSLLLIVALLWDPNAIGSYPGPMMLAFVIYAGAWSLFAASFLRASRTKRLSSQNGATKFAR